MSDVGAAPTTCADCGWETPHGDRCSSCQELANLVSDKRCLLFVTRGCTRNRASGAAICAEHLQEADRLREAAK